ncbi:MAG: hypothetical protein K1X88_05735 [Nannocystaceae bacterium]|nr:hypothetical protein [Nannocystaceae bacterium]
MEDETRVLRAISTVMFVLGMGALLLFLRDPSLQRQPQAILFGATATVGASVLRALARLLGRRPPQ